MKEKMVPRFWLIVVVAVAVCFDFFYVSLHSNSKGVKEKVGKEVVKLLYDFASMEQLEGQQLQLKSKVTEDVFNQLTVDNEERRLNTYLKFSGEVSTVEFLIVTDRYLVYRLDCVALESSRVFLFAYNVNSLGKIDRVYEAELIGFVAGKEQWNLWD